MKGLAKDLKNCSFHLNNVCVGDTKKSAEKFSKLKLSISGVALRFYTFLKSFVKQTESPHKQQLHKFGYNFNILLYLLLLLRK
jgi:hypothetical protein